MSDLPDGLVDRLVGLHEACLRVIDVAASMQLESLLDKVINQLALSKAVEIVGEIAAGIVRKYPDFSNEHPSLRPRDAAAMRNVIVHGYETISFETLWRTVGREIPELKNQLEPILTDAGEQLP